MVAINVTKENTDKALATADALLDAMRDLTDTVKHRAHEGVSPTVGQTLNAIGQLANGLDAVTHLLEAYKGIAPPSAPLPRARTIPGP